MALSIESMHKRLKFSKHAEFAEFDRMLWRLWILYRGSRLLRDIFIKHSYSRLKFGYYYIYFNTKNRLNRRQRDNRHSATAIALGQNEAEPWPALQDTIGRCLLLACQSTWICQNDVELFIEYLQIAISFNIHTIRFNYYIPIKNSLATLAIIVYTFSEKCVDVSSHNIYIYLFMYDI